MLGRERTLLGRIHRPTLETKAIMLAHRTNACILSHTTADGSGFGTEPDILEGLAAQVTYDVLEAEFNVASR